MISGIPFDGPLGAVRMAYSQDGDWIPHPTYEEVEDGTFELVVAGRELDNGDVAVMMVEAGGTEKSFYYYEDGAKKVDEAVLADGLEACKVWIKESIALQRQLVASVIATQGPIEPLTFEPVIDYSPEVYAAVEGVVSSDIAEAVKIADKHERNAATDAASAKAVEALCGEGADFDGQEKAVKEAVRSLTKNSVRQRVIDEGIRLDGRGPTDLRPVSAEVGVLPTAHGSGSVHPWRDAGDERAHDGDAADEPDDRLVVADRHEAVPAPLQHAAVGQRRDRPRRFAEAS